ncbi:MAG TPA: peptidylprolyl isomerase [Steroidobacteraceae bacterium]|nr:peptidylprolyl isomerase [Steroidobacteraceae bacterium]
MVRPLLASLALLLAGAAAAADAPPPPPAPAPPAAAATSTAAATGKLLDRVVAIVNDGVVTQSDLDEQTAMIVDRLKEQKTQLPPADVLRKQVLDRLIVQEVQFQRAERIGLKVSDEQVNGALADIAQRNGIALAQLPAALQQQGIDFAGFRDNIRKEITLQMLRQRDVLSKISVTPRELEQFIERLKKLPSETDEYNLAHILLAIPPDATQAQVDEIAKRAQELYERSKTEDFSRLAVAYSNSQTALEGGALGWRKGPELPTFLAEVVVGLKPGEVSKPLATPNGYHLVKLVGVRSTQGSPIEDQVHARHILMKPNQLQDDATVKQKLSSIRERILKGEEFAAFASSMSEDSSSSVNGGDLGWSGPGTFVPEFESVLAGLKENEISEPFRTQFGWHIVQLLGRRQFDTTEESLRQRAFRQLRESKADEETELWVRRLRDEAFVDTDL